MKIIKKTKEHRNVDIDVQSVNTDKDQMIIEGYAIVFESPATHGFTEIIDKRALDNTDMTDVALKYNHSDNVLVLARTRNGSLELIPDDYGLKIKANLINTQQNRDIYKMIQERLLDKMSFAFTVKEDTWDQETETRRILDIDKIFDVSVVDEPFYSDTELYARSKKNMQKEQFNLNKRKLKMKLELE